MKAKAFQLSVFFISFIVGIAAYSPFATYEVVQLNKLDPKINLNATCETFKDCYNCTLARCYWGGAGCKGEAKGMLVDLQREK